jgi:hypothetical protein
MDKAFVGLVTLAAYVVGMLLTYTFSWLVFNYFKWKAKRFHKELNSNETNLVVWREGMSGLFVGYVVGFLWITFIVVWEFVIMYDHSPTTTDEMIHVTTILAGIFALVCCLCAIVTAIEGTFYIVAVNDSGVQRYRIDLVGYKPSASIDWDDVTEIRSYRGAGHEASFGVVGNGETIWISNDSNDLTPLCDLMMKKVARDTFTIEAYSNCRVFAS